MLVCFIGSLFTSYYLCVIDYYYIIVYYEFSKKSTCGVLTPSLFKVVWLDFIHNYFILFLGQILIKVLFS